MVSWWTIVVPYNIRWISITHRWELATNYWGIFITLAMVRQKTFGQKTTIVTFDQPLFIKSSDIVLRLRGFHTWISYLDCIDYIMVGSSLKKVLGLIYAPNSGDKILTGHAYARTIRAHMLLHESLPRLIFVEPSHADAQFRIGYRKFF